MKKKKHEFFVLNMDINTNELTKYDIIPYLDGQYKKLPKTRRPKTFDDFKQFIIAEAMHMWWSRCEYEIVVTDMFKRNEKKIDIFYQVEMNIDNITNIFMEDKNGSEL